MVAPWPNDARVAVMFTFDFDAESGWLSRDPSPRDRPGVISQGTYGAKVGVPRILDLLKAENVPATFFIPGWVVEHHPDKAKMIRDAGYEIGHHGYLHERAKPEDPEGEKRGFELGMKALESVLGVRPAGYRSPGWDLTPITLDLVKQHGMFYSSNLMDDVFPYVHPGTSIVELPVQWDLDDAPFFMFHPTLLNRPMNSPEIVYGIWRDEFLGMYEWGGLFNLTCHPQVIGHPSRLLMLRRLIRFIKEHARVWWATGRDVAQHWLARGRA
ncbi:MAG: ribulose phosphate epimerase [Candidatus Rokubacteria bacterium 13_1_40CM_69_27]|nr:MAG: ribulose phosphate epimerase [Candidatus Rokubacteria bacterium 13_1_40CM_69_27]OLC34991.1 MAG: ribulose phosphate epimerase [Candidatus Rokubacteria bacterium 13_1_40CM_4_69_5]OLE39087.1 MAG: ribulose phosphate epimerase [Candidatus Rokubacteria bacterium 13_1_20CM_2_70_7]